MSSRTASTSDETARELGGLLTGLRRRAGLSVRDLAAALGASPSTVSEAERGRDVRRSTLAGYLRRFPGLTAHDLIGSGPPPPPQASRAAWTHWRDAFGFSVKRLRFEVRLDSDGQRRTLIEATGIRCTRGSLSDAARRCAVMQLVFRGSPDARRRVVARSSDLEGEPLVLDDGCYRHVFGFSRRLSRGGISYTREQPGDDEPPPGASAPGRLAISAPFDEGLSFAVEQPTEVLELTARFAEGHLPAFARTAAWTNLQSVAADAPDFVPSLHPDGLSVVRGPRSHALKLTVPQPLGGLHYGLGWDPKTAGAEPDETTRPSAPPARPESGVALRQAREEASLSLRELAERLGVSPATVAGAEQGQDVRRSFLIGCLRELPSLTAASLLPPTEQEGSIDRLEAWEYYRRLLGVESDEERKTLVITASGDAHAVCETIRLRRVRPSEGELRIRYGSALAKGRRFPTELKAIEEELAAEAEESGLRARVIERREGRLIHEIIVPRDSARAGASYSRRLFNPQFFDPSTRGSASEVPQHDGAAIVPFHAARRLALVVRFPGGYWPEHVWFGVHPRMMLDEPLPDASLAEHLHPEGLTVTRSLDSRSLELTVEHPLVGFMYDVFWERP